jgi:hypothetical protein
MRYLKISLSVIILFFVMVAPVMALQSSQPAKDVLFSSNVFQKFDVRLINDVGLILPIIIAWFAIKVAYLMRGGKLEDVWKLIAAGMSVLALVKVVDGLEQLDVLYVGGLRSVLEFVMILVFFAAFLLAYQSLVFAIRGPIPVEKPEIDLPEEKKEEQNASEEGGEKTGEEEKK